MAEIKAFKPLRYTEKAGKIENNVCPPYDIVDKDLRAELCERSPYNLIRLELPEGDDKYKAAKALLCKFVSEGILAKDDEEGIFIYEEEFILKGIKRTLDGLMCLCKTYDFADKIVLPHEETLSKAKQDRFELMAETFCNFSPVYSLYDDEKGFISGIIKEHKNNNPLAELSDSAGIIHRLWKIGGKDAISNIVNFFAPKKLYIADGHHRYETARLFHNHCIKNGISADSGYIMMALVDINSPGLAVLPTHRVITGMNIDAGRLAAEAADDFTITSYDDFSKVEETLEKVSDKNAFALYTGSGFRLFVLKKKAEAGSAVKELDVSVLHDMMLEKYLGIDKANLAGQKNLIYTRDIAEAKSKVDSGLASAAFLLQPTKVEQIKKVALEGSKMPQKSTYFYPKLITGLLINRFKD